MPSLELVERLACQGGSRIELIWLNQLPWKLPQRREITPDNQTPPGFDLIQSWRYT